MPATYVTEQELRDNLGIGDLYADSIIEECCQSAQDILNQFLWFDSAISTRLLKLSLHPLQFEPFDVPRTSGPLYGTLISCANSN